MTGLSRKFFESFFVVFVSSIAVAGCSDDDPVSTRKKPTLVTFARTYGDDTFSSCLSIEPTNDGGYVATGRTGSTGLYDGDLFILKIDARGDTAWARVYGAPQPGRGHAVQELADGGFLVVGEKGNFGSTQARCWLLRTDANGDTTWTRSYAGAGNATGWDVLISSTEAFWIAGTTEPASGEQANFWLLRTNLQGEEVWSRSYGTPEHESAFSAVLVSTGGFALCGVTDDVDEWGDETGDVWLLRTDADGDSLWSRHYGGNHADWGFCVIESGDGGFVISATSRSFGDGDQDGWLIRTDAEGNVVWDQVHGGTRDDGAWCVRQAVGGGFVVAGYRDDPTADLWLFKTNMNGETVWERTYGGADDDWGYRVEPTRDGGYIVAGTTESFGAARSMVWILKTDAAGRVPGY